MAGYDKDEVPMLSDTRSRLSDDSLNDEPRRYCSRSASMSISMTALGNFDSDNTLISHTGPLRSERSSFIPRSGPIYRNRKFDNFIVPVHDLVDRKTPGVLGELSSANVMGERDQGDDKFGGKNEHLLKSGPLGVCNDPYCTTCPTFYNFKAGIQQSSKASDLSKTKVYNARYGDAKGWARRTLSFFGSYIPGVMNPHAKVVQQWNKFFVISCLVAIFIDPLFFFLLSVRQDSKCIVLDWPLATSTAVVRSVTDFIYLLHMLLQFRLAYVAPESRVMGAGDLVDHPKKIALHYLYGRYFIMDLFVVLPLPQIMILIVIPKYLATSGANYAKNLLRASVLLQYVPRIIRFVPLLAGQSASGFIFESAWANFVINLLIFVLAGHVVGSCWYLFGLQRVNKCLRDACVNSSIQNCSSFIDCGRGNKFENFARMPSWQLWKDDGNSSNCFVASGGPFTYGIYQSAVSITTEQSIITRYIYSLFWGFQQISTLAGNQIPSSFVWEVLFTMGIIGLGLFLFALLIGNMQNFLQSLGRRRLEMQLRRRDVERWMSHRRLPDELRRRVRQSERFNWAATRGVNEELLLENLPEDVQQDIRRHLFKFIKKVRIFTLMEEPILDAICEKLRQKLYIGGSKILLKGGPIEKMVFIVRGKLDSIGGDGNVAPLSEGDVCGEELLTWLLEHNKDGRKISLAGHRLLSNRTVICLTNVESFALRADDLEEVTTHFARFLRNPRVQGAIRYESPYWRTRAAVCIQVSWRYRKKRLNRTESPEHESS